MPKHAAVFRTVSKALGATILLGLPGTSFAFLGELKATLGFEVTAGVDKETLAVIKALPADVRTEVFKILDRTDRSVYGYLDKVNETVRNAVDELSCAATGAGYGAGKGLKQVLGFTPNDVKDMKDALIEIRKDFSYKTTADDFTTVYADYDASARTVVCAEGRTSATGREMTRLRGQASESYILWARLRDMCTRSEDCYALVYKTLKDNLSSAARQDLAMTRAEERFASFKPSIERKSSFLGLANTYNVQEYEQALGKMLFLSDQLLLVSTSRIEKAKVRLSEQERYLASAEADLSNARKLASGNTSQRVHSCNLGYSLTARGQALAQGLEQVKSFEMLTQPQLAEYQARLDTIASTAKSLQAYSSDEVGNNKSKCYVNKIWYDPHTDHSPH
ncbi:MULTISPECIES: hypothetical protein [unclassified Pseudomonas]|uniref:hypothetical protein n=1 Tax=unclassified Pseudomonas TaxID=196821 RepID=UPI00117AC9BB|nr:MULTISPECIES: hypothetical protein [unclassified Pseudomonas]